MMVVTHFLENRKIVLSQLRDQLPSINEQIKIKGRKGKVLDVYHADEKTVYVEILFEQVKKKNIPIDQKKKK